jgi:NADH:ubiquinone oxidoreductase subunit D
MSMKFCKASGATAMDLNAVEGHCGCRRVRCQQNNPMNAFVAIIGSLDIVFGEIDR